MSQEYSIFIIGLIILLSYVSNSIFLKIKVPNVVLFILVGILIGPVLHLINTDEISDLGNILAKITFYLILFNAGINLKINKLLKEAKTGLFFALINFIVSSIVIIVFISLFFAQHLNIWQILFYGTIFGGISSSIIIPVLKNFSLSEDCRNALYYESIISDMLCLLSGTLLLSFVDFEQSPNELLPLINTFFMRTLFSVLIGLAFGLIFSFLLKYFRLETNYRYLFLGFLLFVAGLMQILQFNDGLAIISMALVIGNMKYLHSKQFTYLTINDKIFLTDLDIVLESFFFTYIGLLFPLNHINSIILAFIAVVILIAFRYILFQLVFKNSISTKCIKISGLLNNKGLVPFIFITTTTFTTPEIKNFLASVIVLSILSGGAVYFYYRLKFPPKTEKEPILK
jgi:NhaP-type Na+/H+ or K+/H+ antiporter